MYTWCYFITTIYLEDTGTSAKGDVMLQLCLTTWDHKTNWGTAQGGNWNPGPWPNQLYSTGEWQADETYFIFTSSWGIKKHPKIFIHSQLGSVDKDRYTYTRLGVHCLIHCLISVLLYIFPPYRTHCDTNLLIPKHNLKGRPILISPRGNLLYLPFQKHTKQKWITCLILSEFIFECVTFCGKRPWKLGYMFRKPW